MIMLRQQDFSHIAIVLLCHKTKTEKNYFQAIEMLLFFFNFCCSN